MASDASRYTLVPNTLEKLLNRVPELGRPDKVNSSWLASIGMGGGNNQSILRVLKGLGAVGNDGVPTELWGALRAKDKTKIGARCGACMPTCTRSIPTPRTRMQRP
jgi:hypothetical protein